MIAARLASSAGVPLVSVADHDGALVVSFSATVRACSWAIVHGGLVDTEHVAWFQVSSTELGVTVDARAWLRERLRKRRLDRAVGLLTSRRVSSRIDATVVEGDVTARAVVTVGLGNALRAGDRSAAGPRVGTINMLVHVDQSLSDEALLEANAIATEAKCGALFDARVASRVSGRPATGTGTDCTVVTCPSWPRPAAEYAGKHTAIGSAVGAAVERAIAIGIREWRRDTGQ